MPRSVTEWIGKTDDSAPTTKCKQRIIERQNGCCALTGRPFTPKDKPQFDHKVPLWLGGANRESNLQAILTEPHKAKTAGESKVRAKVMAANAKHLGITVPKQKIPGRGFPPSPKPRTQKQPLAPRSLFYVPGEMLQPIGGECE